MASDNGKQESARPRNVRMQIGIDWESDTVIFQEQAQGGIQLVNPWTFNVPADTIIQLADSIRDHKLEMLRRLKTQAKELSTQLSKDAAQAMRDGILKKS